MRGRTTAVAVLAVALALVPITWAVADEWVPEDVERAFATEVLDAMHSSLDGVHLSEPVDFGDVAGFGAIHEVFHWSPDFLAGKETETPNMPIHEWVAPALWADGEVAGTARVWRPEEASPAEFAAYDDNVELGMALLSAPDDARLVQDPTIAAWYVVEDGVVTALNDKATEEAPEAMGLVDFQGILAQRHESAIRDAPFDPAPLVIGGLLLLLAIAALVSRQRSRP